jgi:uncharacterized protein YvpB
VLYEGLDEPEGLAVDPRTGDFVVLNDPLFGGGSIYRILADGSEGYQFSSNFGADDDLVVDNQGYIYIRIAPDGSGYEVVAADVGPVEELAFDPGTNDVYWGAIEPRPMIGKIPGGVGCSCPTIIPPIPVGAMVYDGNDEIAGADLVISQFFSDWVYLVDFASATFVPVVPNPGAAEDLAIWNGRIIYPDNYYGGVYEISPITKFVQLLIPKSEIRLPAGVVVVGGLSPTPTLTPTPTQMPTPTPTPGKLLDVPKFMQTDPWWGNLQYDHGFIQDLWCGETIGECGCALSSIAMVLKYHGVDKDPYGRPTTPETVNKFFREGGKCKHGSCNSIGYAFGGVVWSAANRYSKKANRHYDTPLIIYNGGGSKLGHYPEIYRSEIDDNNPVILAVRRHFIVATGYEENTFAIHDPYYTDRTQLDHPAYSNTSLGYHRYKKTSTDYSSLEIVTLSPTQVLVTDPLGNQTGFDQPNSTITQEIPNSTYFFDPAVSSQGPPPPVDAGVYWVIISTPLAGDYQIQIFNPDDEPGSYAIYASDRDADLIFDLFEVPPSEQPAIQTITYNPDPGEIPLVLQVPIDIKPGSDPNSINCRNENGVVPVAILSTEMFDATTVDHTTVTFAGATETHVDKKTGLPQRHEEDVDEGGDLDLVFHFRLRDTNLGCQSIVASLSGETNDGTPVQSTGRIQVTKSGA